MSLRKKFITGIGWQSVNVITQIILQLIFIAVMARKLGTEDFGVMAIALAIVGFIEIFSQIGIGPALIQRKDLRDTQINGAFFISLFLGISFTTLLYFVAPAIAAFYDHAPLEPVLQVIGLSFLISAVSIVPKSLIVKAMDFKKLFIAALIAMSIGNLLIGITLAFLGYKVWAYVFALLAQNVIMSICYWIQRPVKIQWNWNWSGTRSMVRYGGGSTLFNMFNYAATKADTLIVGKFAGGNLTGESGTSDWSQTGIYDRSVWLMGLPITVLGKLSDSVMFSGLSMIQDQQAKLQRAYLSGTYLISTLIIPGCIFMIFFAPEIVMLFLGDQYHDAVPVVRILFAGVALRSLIKLSDAVVRALDVVFKASLIKGLFLALICTATLVGLKWELTGVAAGIVIAIFVQYVMMTILSLSRIRLAYKKVFQKMIPGLILGAVITLLSWFALKVNSNIPSSALLKLGIAIAINLTGLLLIALSMPWIFGKGEDNIIFIGARRLPLKGFLGKIRKHLLKE